MSRTRALCALVTIASLAVLPAAAQAATTIYMEADGIPGESTAQGFENQIELQSFSLGASRAKFGKAPSFGDFSFMKFVDTTSPVFLQDVASGKVVSSVKVHLVKAATQPFEFLRYCFTGVQFTSDQVSGSGGGELPAESLSFNYQTIVERFIPQNNDGSQGTSIFGGWDLVKNLQFGGPGSC